MNPHPNVNPKIENCLSSLWALTLTSCKIWMSRLDKPAGTSLWSSKPLFSQRRMQKQEVRPYFPRILFPIFIHIGLIDWIWRCVTRDVLVEEPSAGLCYDHRGHGGRRYLGLVSSRSRFNERSESTWRALSAFTAIFSPTIPTQLSSGRG